MRFIHNFAAIALGLSLCNAVHAEALLSFGVEQQGEVLAKSGPAVVTQNDFDAYLTRIPERDHAAFLNSPARVEQAITQLLVVRHYMAEAKRTGLLEEPIHQALMFQTAAVLIAERMTDRFVQENMLEDYSERAREMFLSSPRRFRHPDRLDFTHLFVRVAADDDQVEAMQQMLDLHEQLENGTSLDELLMEYSEDPLLEDNQGRYQGVDEKEIDGVVRSHLLQLDPGQRSQPFPSSRGWHIVRLDARHEGGAPEDFGEVREHAIKVARNDHRTRLQERLRSRLIDEHSVEIPEGAVRELLKRHGVSWSRDFQDLTTQD